MFYEQFFLGGLRTRTPDALRRLTNTPNQRWLSALKEDSEIKQFCIDTLNERLVKQQTREQELQTGIRITHETIEALNESS